MRILVVAQEKSEASFIKKGLTAMSFGVDAVSELREGAAMAEEIDYDLVILDCGTSDGKSVGEFRQVQCKREPPLLLMAIVGGSAEHRIGALGKGADDCLSRPVRFTELAAHVRALVRRRGFPREPVLRVADLELELASMVATRAGRRIELTPREYSLLLWLMRNEDRVLTRQVALDRVWNTSFDRHSNVVDVYINYLRRKVDDGSERKLIHTVRGVGYRMSASE